jgi:hypothetical protein
MPGGGKGKKGGGGSISVDVTDTANASVALDIVGLDDINLSTELKVPDPIQTRSELVLPQPLKTEMRNELAITEPIVTQMTTAATVDVKPIDVCLTFGISKLPNAFIGRCSEQRFGISLFGQELVGFNWSSRSEWLIDDATPRPHLELGGRESVQHHERPAPRPPTVVGRPGREALRIRVGT